MKNVKWKVALIAATVLLAFIFFLPNTPIFSYMPQWWKDNMPNRGIALGLDLQGGVHLVFEVEGERAVQITLERIADRLRDILRKRKLEAEITVEGERILVKSTQPEVRQAITDAYPTLDMVPSDSEMVFKLDDREVRRIKDNAAEQALETIRNRVDQFGVAEPVIHRQGANEIVVQLPGYKDPKRAVELIGKTAQLEFRLVDDEAKVAAELPAYIRPGEEQELIEKFKDKIPSDDTILFQRVVDRQTGEVRKKPFLLKKEVLLTGDLLSEARVAIDQRFNEPYVSLTFNKTGADIFEEVTGKYVQKRLAIILDKNVYSAPVIRERIAGGNAQITGAFSMEEAKDLAIVLRAGALPAPVKLLQNVTVGPSLGRDSIEAGKKAGIIAIILVTVFMVFYYRLSGLIADFAMLLNVILLLGAMAFLNATLTMPGIAGIVLAIGMAVDSNVLMFERMREELRAGKTPRAAVDSGYDKAFITIVDSHVTTLITAAVLFQFGTGPIKGFAVTLSLGVAINLFTALVGTKTVFDIINSRREVKKLSI
ncbi:MAG: protein translocase subunit SecD [Nitrospirae bacterium]|nr:MAG: protein translocase subunit SecD [Nitrospirota bacterium]